MEQNIIRRRTPHLSTLKQRHAALEASIQEEALRPMPDFLSIQRLKRERLLLKDAIVSVERDVQRHSRVRTLRNPA